MTDNEPTIESLQADLIALKESTEALQAQAKADAEARAKLEADLKAARDLNAKLISRETVAPEQKEDPYAGMSDEDFLNDAILRIVDREAEKMVKKEA